ncbi:MAG: CmcJ/NvfI family oxidoreductase [Defluviicoccus sp.]|nr:CmcJ/NvfI family oxidoreductase [Defluviicoccus sp.]
MTQTMQSVSAGADLVAPLTFIVPQDTKPAFHSTALTGGAQKLFFETESIAVSIADMRPLAGDLSVDREGFELHRHATAVADLYDDEAVETRYYPEIEALLNERFGADRTVVFDATRRADSETGAHNPDGLRGPAIRAHVDYTVLSGPQRVADILGEDEATRLAASGAHIVQINVWRPISGPVRRSPLAVADASSVAPAQLLATDQVFPDRVGEIYLLAHAPTQRWYYAPEMTPDEILLIKGWDSIDDGRARFTPHGAFRFAQTPDAAPRESIEVRALVVIGNAEVG